MFCELFVYFLICCVCFVQFSCCALQLRATEEKKEAERAWATLPCLESTTRESCHVDFALCCKGHHDGVVPQFSQRGAVKDSSCGCSLCGISCCSHLQQVREAGGKIKKISVICLAMAAIQAEHNGKCPLSHILDLGSPKVRQ